MSDESSKERTVDGGAVNGLACELCAAARCTEWFHEDDECWVAECEACSVPMVVWRVHDPHPPDEVKARLHEKLLAAVARHFDGDVRIDDTLRTIADHYHAHARPRMWGQRLRRRSVPPAR